MRKSTLCFLTIFLFLKGFLIISYARANEIPENALYVSLEGDDGAGEGTADSPFATAERALKEALPGDTILVRGGTYNKTRLIVSKQGKPNAWITIKAYPGEKVIFDGKGAAEREDDLHESRALLPAIIDIKDARYIVIDGFEVTNSGGYGIATWESENIIVRNCLIHHIWSRGLGGNGAHLLFENNEIHNAVLQNKDEARVDRGLFWTAGAATWYRADKTQSKNITWRGNKIHDVWGEGLIALHVDGAVLEGNTVYNSYSGLIYVDHSRNVRVDSNFVFHNSREHVRRDLKELSPGIMFAAENYEGTEAIMLENIEIVNNVIAGTQVGIGFWRDPSNLSPSNRYKNIVIANNILHDISILPINLAEIRTQDLGTSRNIIANNIIFAARYFLDQYSDTAVSILVRNPELWTVENNVFPDGDVGVLFKDKFQVYQNNTAGVNPKLKDARLVNPLGVEGYMPQHSRLLKGAGLILPEVKKDRTGRERPADKISIGPWELN